MLIKLFIEWPQPHVVANMQAGRGRFVVTVFTLMVFVNLSLCLNETKQDQDLIWLPDAVADVTIGNIPTLTTSTQTPPNVTSSSQLPTTQRSEPAQLPLNNCIDLNICEDDNETTTSLPDSTVYQHNEPELKQPDELEERLGLLKPAASKNRTGFTDSNSTNETSETTTRPRISTTTSTSSYSIDSDKQDNEEYDLRKFYLQDTVSSQLEDETTTLMPTSSSTLAADKNQTKFISNQVRISNRISNMGDDLHALESNSSASSEPASSSKTRSRVPIIVDLDPLDKRDRYVDDQNDNESARTKSRWSSPLSDTYYVPQMSQHPELATRPVMLTKKQQDKTGSEQVKRPIPDTIIPQAGILDLLHIIKHLNLIKSEPNSKQSPSIGDLSKSASQPATASTYKQPIAFYGLDPGASNHRSVINEGLKQRPFKTETKTNQVSNMLPNPSSPSEALLDESQNDSRLLLEKKRATMNKKMEPKLGSMDTKSMLTKFTSPVLDNDSTTTTTRPHRISLISPYSANFDSGQSTTKNTNINRASMVSMKDQLHASKSLDTNDHDNGSSEHKNRLSSDSSVSRSSHKQIQIGSKPNYQTNISSNRDKSRQTNLSQESHKTQNSNQNNQKQTGGDFSQNNRHTSSSANMRIKDHAELNTDNNSKRGERDANNDKLDLQSTQKGSTDSTSDSSSRNRLNKSTNNSASLQRQLLNHQDRNQKRPPDYKVDSDQLRRQHQPPNRIRPNENQLSGPVVSKIASYLDDPHKKSYYWTSENGNIFMDDLDGPASPSLASHHFPQPLTIGELARQHGINPLPGTPNSLISEFKINHLHHTSEDFGLFSESGTHEDFANHDRQQHTFTQDGDTLNGKQTLSKSGFKLDDELKQKIAIKAFEAATRDPELSAALYGSLFNLSSDAQTALQQFPLNDIPTTQTHDHYPHQPLPIMNQAHYPTEVNLETGSINHEAIPTTNNYYSMPNNKMPSIETPSMIPLAAMQENLMIPSAALHHVASPTAAGQAGLSSPVNLVIADLANKWALSRLPDLIPIPLAATVPGYLIRLPNGKILAAALTNMFSIQGIQQGPLTNSYKNIINHKFKGLIKQQQQQQLHTMKPTNSKQSSFASLASDSGMRPTILLPSQGFRQSPPMPYGHITGSRPKNINKSHKERGSLFRGRGVLSQLLGGASVMGVGGGYRNYQNLRHKDWQSGGKQANSKQQHLEGNIDKSKMVELLANLPIASPNEPVFSFADESELADDLEPDYKMAASTLPLFGQHMQMPGASALESSSLINQPQNEIFDGSGRFIQLKDRLSHLLSLRNATSLTSNDLFRQYADRKRESSSSRRSFFFPLKLDPVKNWLASKRDKMQFNHRNTKFCNDKK